MDESCVTIRLACAYAALRSRRVVDTVMVPRRENTDDRTHKTKSGTEWCSTRGDRVATAYYVGRLVDLRPLSMERRARAATTCALV